MGRTRRRSGWLGGTVAAVAVLGLPVVALGPAAAVDRGTGPTGGAGTVANGGPAPWAPPLQPPAASALVHRRSPADEQVLGVAAGPAGQVVVAGTYKGAGVLGQPPAEAPLPWASGARYDLFVAAYDAAGNLQWVRTATGTGDDRATDVAVDGAGNVFVGVATGSAPLTFDDGVTTAPAGYHVAELSPSGVPQWVVPLGKGDPQVAADGAGGVFVAGTFTGSTTFGSGGAAQTRISAGSTDVYVARLDAAGALTWVARGGTPASDTVADVATASDGGPTLASTVGGSATFRSGSGLAVAASPAFGGDDVAVTHWSATGIVAWAGGLGGPGADRAAALDARPDGTTRVVGRFEGTASVGAATLTSAGAGDGFLAQLDAAGAVAWAARAGGETEEQLLSVTADGSGNPVVLGTIAADGTVTGPDGTSQAVLNDRSYAPTATSFLAGFAGTGPSWVSAVHRIDGSPGGPVLRAVVARPGGGVTVGGTVSGTPIAFGEGADAAVAATSVATYGDVALAHYPQPPAAAAVMPPACAQVAWIGPPKDWYGGASVLWIGDPAGSVAPFPGVEPYVAAGPWWSPDGKKLAWIGNGAILQGGQHPLQVANADGTGPVVTVGAVHPQDLVPDWAPAFSADSTQVAWVASTWATYLYVARVDGSAPAKAVSLADRGTPLFDRSSILFVRTVSGIGRVYSVAPDGTTGSVVSLPSEPALAPLGVHRLPRLPFLVWGTSSAIRYVLPSSVPEERVSGSYAADGVQRILLDPTDDLLSWTEWPPSSGPRVRIDTWPVGTWSTFDFHGYAAVPPGAPGIIGEGWNRDGSSLLFLEPSSASPPVTRATVGRGDHLSAVRLLPRAPFTLSADAGAQWSPDGKHVLYAGPHGAFVIDANGTRGPRRLGPGGWTAPAWSPTSGSAQLTLAAVGPATPAVAGQPFTVTFTVHDDGRCPGTGVHVDPVTLYGNARLTGFTASQGTLTASGWQVGTVGVGSTATLQLQLVADAPTSFGGSFAVAGNEPDPIAVDDTAWLNVPVGP